VLISSQLQYKVTVDNDAASPITNRAHFYESNIYPDGMESNIVETKLGGSIGGLIWHDIDRDGMQSAAEPGLSGVEVSLTPPTNIDVGAGFGQPITTSTGEDGYYLFTNIPAGNYKIEVSTNTLPLGLIQTADPDSTLDNAHAVTLAASQHYLTANFGYDDSGIIEGIVFEDNNGSTAIDAGEIGIPDVTLTLYSDLNNNKQVDEGEPALFTCKTGIDGKYSFNGLPAGNYIVAVNKMSSRILAGSMSTMPETVAVSLSTGDSEDDVNFGFTQPSSICGKIWFDINTDGTQSQGEPGMMGIQVKLTGPFGTSYANTTADGSYSFTELLSGTYTVEVNVHTLPDSYVLCFDPDEVKDNTHTINLGIGENYSKEIWCLDYNSSCIFS
jgi:uncharacterized protein (DUF2141 family)